MSKKMLTVYLDALCYPDPEALAAEMERLKTLPPQRAIRALALRDGDFRKMLSEALERNA